MADVRHIPCGPCVNASEVTAIGRLKSKLQALPSGPWVILSNLNHSSGAGQSSDEIDLFVVGPSGVSVVEVKHWDAAYLKQSEYAVFNEVEKLNSKVKRVATKLRKSFDVGFIKGKFLLTRGELRLVQQRVEIRGSKFFGLPDLAELVDASAAAVLTGDQIRRIAKAVEPLTKITLEGDLRSFGALTNLDRISPPAEAFHRVYRGQHATRRDRVLLHLYDLSASDDKKAEEIARREFEVIQRWQKSPLVPSLLDSFQEAVGYPGEMFYFTLLDPAAPTLGERRKDGGWSVEERIRFATESANALCQFHEPDDPALKAIIHRRISPDTLRVRASGSPLFTDFSFTRIEGGETIARALHDFGPLKMFVAPEMVTGGWAAADQRSDVYSLCASLKTVFNAEHESEATKEILDSGLAEEASARPTARMLADALRSVSSPSSRPVDELRPLTDPEYWDEETIVPFQNSRYKIIARLGKGGIGQTFKVVEVDAHSEELYGTYVAKVILHREDADGALRAYKRVRSYTSHPHLSTIHEIAPEWQPRTFVALLKWLEGTPLDDLRGVIELHAEELQESSPEDLVLRWLVDLCDALACLHDNGLVHGDVSPRNVIVQGGSVVLTDYDTVVSTGEQPTAANPQYASPSARQGLRTFPRDDLYALAASFYYVLFDKMPRPAAAARSGPRSLNWEGVDREAFPLLAEFFERAMGVEPEGRFQTARDASSALKALRERLAEPAPIMGPTSMPELRPPVLTKQRVPWLEELLSVYPGGRHGNLETRGLDSEFAVATYVETRLDHAIRERIERAAVELVILFGNAGDGKTAFLQHLLSGLGMLPPPSAQRVSEQQLPDGRHLLVNLDGSAAWNGRSADELLDQVFDPFLHGEICRDRIHIVAVNSGKLLEWLDAQEEETQLSMQLSAALQGDAQALNQRHVLIDLNLRSLVGGIEVEKQDISAEFLDALLDRLLGGQAAHDPWGPCVECVSQRHCTARKSVVALRDPVQGPTIRRRLTDALQAVHHRGEIHITARELRAALSYIFFGLNTCDETHDADSPAEMHFADRAFDALSPCRQGELLQEMVRFDPALDSDPSHEKALLRGKDPAISLSTMKRISYFRGSLSQLDADGRSPSLAQGEQLDRFRRVPLMSSAERSELLQSLCKGISRLEDLPRLALDCGDGVPLRITPRTPTESAFWVVKPWSHFRLEAPLHQSKEGLEALHTQLHLVYQREEGHEERLVIGLELFHLLLDLAEGMQLSGTAQEGVFANLEVFSQRLAREDARTLQAWHPSQPERVSQIRVEQRGDRQWLSREDLR